MLAIATCNYPAGVPDCNGHSTVFDGVAYLPDADTSRDSCILEAGGAEGVCVRQDEFLSAVEGGAGRLRIDALCAESVQSLEACVRMGAVRVCTPCPEHLTELMQRELLSEPPAALKK